MLHMCGIVSAYVFFVFNTTECVYMEVYPPPTPYMICKIEELRKVVYKYNKSTCIPAPLMFRILKEVLRLQ